MSDDDPGGINGRDASAVNTSLTLQALRAQFGARLAEIMAETLAFDLKTIGHRA